MRRRLGGRLTGRMGCGRAADAVSRETIPIGRRKKKACSRDRGLARGRRTPCAHSSARWFGWRPLAGRAEDGAKTLVEERRAAWSSAASTAGLAGRGPSSGAASIRERRRRFQGAVSGGQPCRGTAWVRQGPIDGEQKGNYVPHPFNSLLGEIVDVPRSDGGSRCPDFARFVSRHDRDLGAGDRDPVSGFRVAPPRPEGLPAHAAGRTSPWG
jgi:hypothetical protein